MGSDLDGVVVVIPAYNEAAVIEGVIQEVRTQFSRVVCVDDASIDETALLAHRGGATVLRHPVNRGQGAALQTGMEWALRDTRTRAIVSFDADGQHRPADAAAMANLLLSSSVDVVLGSRFSGSTVAMPRMKRVVLKAATAYTRLSSGISVTDTHNGLRVLSRSAASRMQFSHRGMAHASEVLALISQNNLTWTEYPVEVRYTEHSLAKGQSLWNSINILWDLAWRKQS